jgi:tetratricopeptide (TPR) repeat protein
VELRQQLSTLQVQVQARDKLLHDSIAVQNTLRERVENLESTVSNEVGPIGVSALESTLENADVASGFQLKTPQILPPLPATDQQSLITIQMGASAALQSAVSMMTVHEAVSAMEDPEAHVQVAVEFLEKIMDSARKMTGPLNVEELRDGMLKDKSKEEKSVVLKMLGKVKAMKDPLECVKRAVEFIPAPFGDVGGAVVGGVIRVCDAQAHVQTQKQQTLKLAELAVDISYCQIQIVQGVQFVNERTQEMFVDHSKNLRDCLEGVRELLQTFYQESQRKKFIKALFSSGNNQFEEYQRKLRDCRDDFGFVATTINTVVLSSRAALPQIKPSLASGSTNTLLEECVALAQPVEEMLKPVDFFEGTRQPVLDMVNTLIQQGTCECDSDIFWIYGSTGSGKSAVLKQIRVQYKSRVLGTHLCLHTDARTADPIFFMRSLAAQMARNVPSYQAYLKKMSAEQLRGLLDETDEMKAFAGLLSMPLNKLNDTSGISMILIDAIDEAAHGGTNRMLKLVLRLQHDLPKWVRLVVTSRPNVHIDTQLKVDLGESELNRKDVERYLLYELRLKVNAAELEKAVEVLLEKSEALFLYAHFVIEQVCWVDGMVTVKDLGEFPKGMEGIYERDFRRLYTADGSTHETNDTWEATRPLLAMLSACLEPLPVSVAKQALQDVLQDATMWLRAMDAVSGFFPVVIVEGIRCFRSIHKSVVDWMTNTSTVFIFLVDPVEGHAHLADSTLRCLDKLQDGASYATMTSIREKEEMCTLKQYTLRQVAAHHIACKRYKQARDVLSEVVVLQELQNNEAMRLWREAGMGGYEEAAKTITAKVKKWGQPSSQLSMQEILRRTVVVGQFLGACGQYDQAIDVLESELQKEHHASATATAELHSIIGWTYSRREQNCAHVGELNFAHHTKAITHFQQANRMFLIEVVDQKSNSHVSERAECLLRISKLSMQCTEQQMKGFPHKSRRKIVNEMIEQSEKAKSEAEAILHAQQGSDLVNLHQTSAFSYMQLGQLRNYLIFGEDICEDEDEDTTRCFLTCVPSLVTRVSVLQPLLRLSEIELYRKAISEYQVAASLLEENDRAYVVDVYPRILLDIGLLLARIGKDQNALQYFLKAALADELMLGKDHPRIKRCRAILAAHLVTIGRIAEAKAVARGSLLRKRNDVIGAHGTAICDLEVQWHGGDPLVPVPKDTLKPILTDKGGFTGSPWAMKSAVVYSSKALTSLMKHIEGMKIKLREDGGSMTVRELLDFIGFNQFPVLIRGGILRDILMSGAIPDGLLDVDLLFATDVSGMNCLVAKAEQEKWTYSLREVQKNKKGVHSEFLSQSLGGYYTKRKWFEEALSSGHVTNEQLAYMSFGLEYDEHGKHQGLTVEGVRRWSTNKPGWIMGDFACNSLLYCPVNGVLIDPTGTGLYDCLEQPAAVLRKLPTAIDDPYYLFRWLKFRRRGMVLADSAEAEAMMKAFETVGRHPHQQQLFFKWAGLAQDKSLLRNKWAGSRHLLRKGALLENKGFSANTLGDLEDVLEILEKDCLLIQSPAKHRKWMKEHVLPWMQTVGEGAKHRPKRAVGGGDGGEVQQMCGGCFDSQAKVLMADHTFSFAKDVQIGDVLQTPGGGMTRVQARLIQRAGSKSLVKIGNLLISQPHRIRQDDKWIKPIQASGAQLVVANAALHNFVVESRGPIIVNGLVVSTLAMFCEGSHNSDKVTHRVWASERLVHIFRIHPTWPNIRFEANDNFLNTVRSKSFCSTYLQLEGGSNPSVLRHVVQSLL